MDNMQEAVGILKGLLAFQIEDGDFPEYIHEYPKCKHPLLEIKLLPIFYWIIKEYHHVLDKNFISSLSRAARKIVQSSIKKNDTRLPYVFDLTLASSVLAFAHLFDEDSWGEWGEARIEKLHEKLDMKILANSSYLGDLLVALHMIYPSLANSPWKEVWDYLSRTWNGSQYVGIPLREHWEGDLPAPTLHQMWMTYFSRKRWKAPLSEHIAYLRGALIRPSTDRWTPQENTCMTVEYQNIAKHKILSHKTWDTALLECRAEQYVEDGLHAMRTFFGKKKSFVCPRGKYDVDFSLEEAGFNLFFDLSEEVEIDNNRQSREIAVYGSREGIDVRVSGEKASIFCLGETVTMQSASQKIDLKFTLLEGEGKFLGHCMRGRRPSQRKQEIDAKFQAEDHMIFLRTISRKGKCRISLEVRITDLE